MAVNTLDLIGNLIFKIKSIEKILVDNQVNIVPPCHFLNITPSDNNYLIIEPKNLLQSVSDTQPESNNNNINLPLTFGNYNVPSNVSAENTTDNNFLTNLQILSELNTKLEAKIAEQSNIKENDLTQNENINSNPQQLISDNDSDILKTTIDESVGKMEISSFDDEKNLLNTQPIQVDIEFENNMAAIQKDKFDKNMITGAVLIVQSYFQEILQIKHDFSNQNKKEFIFKATAVGCFFNNLSLLLKAKNIFIDYKDINQVFVYW